MKLIKVFIALAILSIGISSAAVTTDLVRHSVSTAAGRVDYAMTYMPSAATGAGATTVGTPAYDTSANDLIIKQFITGLTINKAVDIDSYIFGLSSGGDFAAAGLKVTGHEDATTKVGDASTKNYALYGYVTPNFAYAGQYADQIKGETIAMNARSSNKVTATIGDQPTTAGTQADYTKLGGSVAALPTSTASNFAQSTASLVATPNAVDATPDYTATKVYQFAQAGGSGDSTAYPMGLWAQSMNDKKSTFATSVAGDKITEDLNDKYQSSATRKTESATHLVVGAGDSLAPNDVSMGYADKNIVYSNIDTGLTGNDKTPDYTSTSTITNGAVTTTSTATVIAPKPVGALNEVFVYSLVNSANPNGKSDAVFW